MAQENSNVYGTQLSVYSRNVSLPQGVKIYATNEERVADQVPTSTFSNNMCAAKNCSRRKKIRICEDNQLKRKNDVRARLQAKLKARQEAKKKSQ